MLKLIQPPSQFLIKKTSSGYSYNKADINQNCNFKGLEPSPKGFGLCARMVLEGEKAKGKDGNIWIKKAGRWVKDIEINKYKKKNSTRLSKTKKIIVSKKTQATVLSKYSSMTEWRKTAPIAKKFNKMADDFQNLSEFEWDYKLAEQYNLEEKKQYSIFDKKNNVGKKTKKLTKSEALKIHDEIYKVWDKVSKKSIKLHGYKEYFIPNPQFHNISKPKSFKHNIKTTNDNGFSLDCMCGPNTGDKYLYYESCISNSLSKECNKYITMLNKDLNNIQKALELSKKKKLVDKNVPVKTKKHTKSEALKIHDEIYKVWDKVAKKSKKRYGTEDYLISHPDGLEWGYGTDQKYLDWEGCVTKDRPKRECNKIVTMLKQDLSKMNKALEKVNKHKKTPVKANIKADLKKAKELNDKIYKTWNKISKISKKLYNNKNYIEFHPDYDGLGGWSYPSNTKYSDLKKCISTSDPKRECNKITTLLKKDLSWMERTLNRSIKLQDKMLKTKKLSVSKKKCTQGKVVNPKTGRCINQLKKIDKLLTKANSKLSKAMSSK